MGDIESDLKTVKISKGYSVISGYSGNIIFDFTSYFKVKIVGIVEISTNSGGSVGLWRDSPCIKFSNKTINLSYYGGNGGSNFNRSGNIDITCIGY